MAEENIPKSEPNEDQVYYVEDVDDDDFTFYLDRKTNTALLPPEIVYQDGQEQSGKQSFSRSTNIKVVKISPLLTKSDLTDDGDTLLGELNRALRLSQSESKSKAAWQKLIKTFPRELKRKIQTNWQEEKTKVSLLQKILEKLNYLLVAKDMAQLLSDPREVLNKTERESIKNFSKLGQQVYQNRKKFDKHFKTAIKPFQPQLSPISGRALICRSYQDQLLSVSFRKKSSKSSYEPDQQVTTKYPISIESYCRELYKAIFQFEDEGSAKHGLLVISGATNSSKSEIATGLIYQYLEERIKDSGKRPHLVTFEDPIEKFYAEANVIEASRHSVKNACRRKED